jgi:hypothetical protein
MGSQDITHNPGFYFSNGRRAVRQVVHGDIDHLRITYRITYFEDQNNFYRVLCWSLESKAAGFAGDFDKIAESSRERESNR